MKIIFAITILTTLCSIGLGQERIWTAVTGHEIKAEFVEVKDHCVFLKTAEGIISPPMESLTETSKKLAIQLNTAATRARLAKLTPAMKASTILPANYPVAGNNLIGPYTSEAVDVYLYEPSSMIYIFFKENNQYLSEPLRLILNVFYTDSSKIKNQTFPRPPVKLLDKPSFKNGVFTLHRLHKDDVESELYIEIVKETILIGYQLDDPPGISHETRHYLAIVSPAAYAVEVADDGIKQTYFNPRVPATGVTRTELKEIMSDWVIDVTLRDKPEGLQTSFPYTESTQRLLGRHATSINLQGGVYGPHSVSVAPTGSGGTITPWIYPGRAPMDGFNIYFSKESPRLPANQPNSMLKLTIN